MEVDFDKLAYFTNGWIKRKREKFPNECEDGRP